MGSSENINNNNGTAAATTTRETSNNNSSNTNAMNTTSNATTDRDGGGSGSSSSSTHNASETFTVDLVFKVYAPNLNRVSHRLFLLGSIKPMGAWNIKEAVEAFPTPDVHVWKAEIRGIPIKSNFEWTWLKAKPDRTDIKWERVTKRNRTVDCFSGVIHTIYGDGEEIFIQTASTAEVSTYRKVDEGQVLLLTGSSHTTGSWDLKKAIKATESPRKSGYWKVQVSFDAETSLLFKWAVVRERDRSLYVIEKENHALFGRQAWLRAVAPWNLPQVFIVDTPICLEPSDQLLGRTDLMVSIKKMRSDAIRKWLKNDPHQPMSDWVPISQVPNKKPTGKSLATPTNTTVEEAREKWMAMASVTSSMKANSGVPSDVTPIRVPTVQALENVDDHAKKRAENKNRAERGVTTPNIPLPDTMVHTINGKGQTAVAKTQDHSGLTARLKRNSQWQSKDFLPSDLLFTEHLMHFDTPDVWTAEGTQAEMMVRGFEISMEKSVSAKQDLEAQLFREEMEEDSGLDSWSRRTSCENITDRTSVLADSRQTSCLSIAHDLDKDFLDTDWSHTTTCTRIEDLSAPKEVKDENRIEVYFPNHGWFFEEEDDFLEFLPMRVSKEGCAFSNSFDIKDLEAKYSSFSMSNKRTKSQSFPRNKMNNSEMDVYEFTSNINVPLDDGIWAYKGRDETMVLFQHDKDKEPFEISEERAIARMLEKQWGETYIYGGSGAAFDDNLISDLTLSSPMTHQSPKNIDCFHDWSHGDLVYQSKKPEIGLTHYSKSELMNAIAPVQDLVDHREVARRLETQWGMATTRYDGADLSCGYVELEKVELGLVS